MAKPLDPNDLADLAHRTARLHALKETPGWAELRQIAAERQERHEKMLIGLLKSGHGDVQREFDKQDGFWKGVEFVLEYPDFCEKKLETALKSAQQTEGE